MKIYDMEIEERKQVYEAIDKIIGSEKELAEKCKGMTCSGRSYQFYQYRKMQDKLVKIAENYGTEKLCKAINFRGHEAHGVTASGKTYSFTMNEYGMTDRSGYCGTLYIDGKCKFTSGTVAKVIEYLINN